MDYSQWENLLFCLLDNNFNNLNLNDLDNKVKENFDKINLDEDKNNFIGNERTFHSKNYEDWKDNYLFVENDQVVISKLNLKIAKEIICRDELQKKKLRKMGFIEDRIKIMNIKKSLCYLHLKV